MEGKSTESACVNLLEYVYHCIDNNLYVVGLFFDLSVAFDSINHRFLEYKLNNLGIRGIANNLILSYIEGRKSTVIVQNELSYKYSSTFSVPQGSVLDPFFLICMLMI